MGPAPAPDHVQSGRNDNNFNYSKPYVFDLRIAKPNKTVDIGGNGVSLSMDAQGRVRCSLAIGTNILIPQGVTSVRIPCKAWHRGGKLFRAI